jgi:hypothetical protein
MAESEVAQLRERLELEARAMQRGLYGYACVARHAFIDEKYHSFGLYQQQLATLVGKEEAAYIALEIYIKEVK